MERAGDARGGGARMLVPGTAGAVVIG